MWYRGDATSGHGPADCGANPQMKLTIQKLTKTKVKARIALVGPTGSGKTYTATTIAREITPGRILVIDSERGSADRYADIFNQDDRIDHLKLPDHNPDTYVQALELAASEGYGAVIVDSLSHAWMGHEGALEQIDKLAKRNQSGGSFNAWREVTPMHNRLVNALLDLPAHLIVTMRTKTAYEVTKDDKGKTSVQKLGLAPVQREGIEFEFDLVGDMDADNNFIVSKTRMAFLGGAVVHKPTAKLGRQIVDWLNSGQTEPAVTMKQTSYLDRKLPTMPTQTEQEDATAYLKHTCEFTKEQFEVLKSQSKAHELNWCFVVLEAKTRGITKPAEVVALVGNAEPADPELPDGENTGAEPAEPTYVAVANGVVTKADGTVEGADDAPPTAPIAPTEPVLLVVESDAVAEQIGTYARHQSETPKSEPTDTAFGFKVSKMPIPRQFDNPQSEGQTKLLAAKFNRRRIEGELVEKFGVALATAFGVPVNTSGWAAMVIEFLTDANDDSIDLAIAEAENPQGTLIP
jgi:hypothetical protein